MGIDLPRAVQVNMSVIQRWEWVVEDNQYSHRPVRAELITWLKRNIPQAERTTLRHSDYHCEISSSSTVEL